MLASAPPFNKASTASVWPLRAALISAVHPVLSLAFTFAPFANKARTPSVLFIEAAHINAVRPFLSFVFGLAPCLRSFSICAASCFFAASSSLAFKSCADTGKARDRIMPNVHAGLVTFGLCVVSDSKLRFVPAYSRWNGAKAQKRTQTLPLTAYSRQQAKSPCSCKFVPSQITTELLWTEFRPAGKTRNLPPPKLSNQRINICLIPEDSAALRTHPPCCRGRRRPRSRIPRHTVQERWGFPRSVCSCTTRADLCGFPQKSDSALAPRRRR